MGLQITQLKDTEHHSHKCEGLHKMGIARGGTFVTCSMHFDLPGDYCKECKDMKAQEQVKDVGKVDG